MALRRLMSHVLLAKSNYYKKCQPGVWTHFLNRTESTRTFAMANKYVAVEKGTPNSPNYRVFLSKYIPNSIQSPILFDGFFRCTHFLAVYGTLYLMIYCGIFITQFCRCMREQRVNTSFIKNFCGMKSHEMLINM